MSPSPALRRPSTARPRLVAAALAALLVVLTALVATGVQRPARAAESDSDAVLRIAYSSTVDTFNPFVSIYLTPTGVNRFVYENLVAYGTENEATEGLAESWDTSEDALTWTFTLGDDREWSDGEPVVADDVVFTYTSIMENPETLGANHGLTTNIESVTAVDEKTVEMTLIEPQAANPGFEIPIVPAHVWEGVDDPAAFPADSEVVGSGPFVIESYDETSGTLELVANETYWRGAPEIAGVRYVKYDNVDASVQGLRSGEVDIVGGLTPAQYDTLEADGSGEIATNAGTGRRYLALAINPGATTAGGEAFGDSNPALADPDLRTAILMAVDKEELVDRILGGYGTPGETEVPASYPDFTGFAEGVEPLEFDLDGANALLDEAGYERGPDGTRLDLEGNPLELRLMGDTENADHVQLAEFVGEWLGEIGIAVTPELIGGDAVGERSIAGNYDMYFTSWSLGPDPDFQLSINTCDARPETPGGADNLSESNWCSPEFDALYAEQRTELDPEARSELVRESFSTIYEARVNYPIWYADALEAYRSDRFEGFTLQPEGSGPILGQNGYWGVYGASEVEPGSGGSGAGDGVPGWLLPVGVGAVALVVGGLLLGRRRSAGDDRE